ncbi:hypothetical protein [Photorhabdus cinerea]|uniref:Uncharacterized protein n=1 Tax=Photorhabdus cinerea TaxID=471575 RepID=A0A7X5TJN5_9GAMM|nr:hypothetical protein [Photorhabdus cinerea]NHB94127.1 hypothetical protein [Photorhabdus cinerea]
MDNILKYGDTVTILNSYKNWSGGYLSVFGNGNKPGTKYSVVTVDSSLAIHGGIWRIESATEKLVGSEVINNDIILLYNLYYCDGGYLRYYDVVDQYEQSKEIHHVYTSDIRKKSTLEWVIYCETTPLNGNIREGEGISLYNRWGNKGFLDTHNHAGGSGSLYQVFMSNNTARKSQTGLWKMARVSNPCPPPDIFTNTVSLWR